MATRISVLRFGHRSVSRRGPSVCKAPLRGLVTLVLSAACFVPVSSAQQSASYRNLVLSIQGQIESGDLNRAHASLLVALKQYPANGGLENLLGVVEIQQGHEDRAKQDFALAIAHSPSLTGAYLNLARIAMESADSDAQQQKEALRLYREALVLDPNNPEALYGEATLLMWQHSYEKSLANIEKLDPEARAHARVQAIVCADETGLGHKEKADRAASSMAASPDLAEQDVLLALPALRTAHRADLIELLLTAAGQRQSLSERGLRLLGLAQEAEGKLAEARATLERVYGMNTSATEPLVDLARVALASKDNQGALGYLAHARALQPANPVLAYEYGLVCVQMNLLREARLAMGQAVALAPANPDYALAMGSISSGADALPYLRKYHDLRPNDAVGYLAFGMAYFQNTDYPHASEWLEKAMSDTKTSAAAHYYLGRILNQQGKYQEAIVQLQQSASLKPDQPEVSAELGEAYLRLKDYPAATTQLHRALELDTDSYTANYALLRLYAQTGDPRRTEQAARFAALRKQDEEQYRDAMRVIETRPEALSGNTPE